MNETVTGEIMSLKEMEIKFDGEWVLFDDPYLDEHKHLAGGKLLFHSKNRDEVDEVAICLRPRHSAFLYMGRILYPVALNL